MEPQLHQPCRSKRNAKFDEQYHHSQHCRGNPGFTSGPIFSNNWWNTGQKWHRAGVHLSPLHWFRLGTRRNSLASTKLLPPQVSKFLRLSLMCYSVWTYPFQDWVARPIDGAAQYVRTSVGSTGSHQKRTATAIYVHCGPHCVNLVTQAACSTTPIVRDALQWTHELGCLFGQSGKFKTIFKSVAKSTSGSYITLKPLCPTRWTVRTPAIDAILGQYEAVLAALEEMASSNTSDTASRANGLHERF